MALFADFINRLERGEFDLPCVVSPNSSSSKSQTVQRNVRFRHTAGDYCIGCVSDVKEYGVFVNIDTRRCGLLHRNEFDFLGRNTPSEFFFKGQHIDVKIVRIDSAAKISLAYAPTFGNDTNRTCAIRDGVVVDTDGLLNVLKGYFSDFVCRLMAGLESNGFTAQLCLPRDVKVRMESEGDNKGLRFLEFLKTKQRNSFIVPPDSVDYDNFLLGKATERGWHVLSRRTFAEYFEKYPWIGNCAGGKRRVHPCVWNPKCICLPTLGLRMEND